MPPAVETHLGQGRGQTKPLGGVTLAARADALGLSLVHHYVYEWLSAYVHPSSRTFKSLFATDTRGKTKVRNPERDDSEEVLLGFWPWWFELRILTLAAAQYSINVESLSDDLLAMRDTHPLRTCVFVRESLV